MLRARRDGRMSKTRARTRLSGTVWALGLVSLLMDMSSEAIHALLPLFLTVTLGASVAVVGTIDGIAAAVAPLLKLVSGYVSDRIGQRKPLILAGYGLAAATKPLFALAASAQVVLLARIVDRVGKGLREAPRDALIAEVTKPEQRGRAFGLRQAMDSAGAFIGPLLALALMIALANDIRAVFWIAAIPALIAVAVLALGVREAPRAHRRSQRDREAPITLRDLKRLSPAIWRITVIGGAFSLARLSDAFLILRAHELGLDMALAPLILVAMNLCYALGAYPAGALADRFAARGLLIIGLAALLAADLVLGLAQGLWLVFPGVALWGAHLAMTQGLFAKLVADHAGEGLKGSAFGLFSLVSALALLVANVVAGLLWDAFGAQTTFLAAAAIAALTIPAARFILPAPSAEPTGQER